MRTVRRAVTTVAAIARSRVLRILAFFALTSALIASNQTATGAPAGLDLSQRPVLAYLLRNQAQQADFDAAIQATTRQSKEIRQAIEDLQERQRALKQITEPIVADPSVSNVEKRKRIAELDYNGTVLRAQLTLLQAIQNALTPAQYRQALDWLNRRWNGEIVAAQRPTEQASRSPAFAGFVFQVLHIFATWFLPNSDQPQDQVALPDKYIKFANLDLHALIPISGYEGSDYRVTVVYRGISAQNLRVLDAGPWNINDTYWSYGAGDYQIRRLFGNLPSGIPEAQAAFFPDANGQFYNYGLDEFGRLVVSPTAIDLGPAIRDYLSRPGYPFGADWVDVAFLWRRTPMNFGFGTFMPVAGR